MDDDVDLDEMIKNYGSLEDAESFLEIASVNETVLFKSYEWDSIQPDETTNYGIKVTKSDEGFNIKIVPWVVECMEYLQCFQHLRMTTINLGY